MLQQLGKILIEKKLTIAFAESATAGRLCSEFSLIENAGSFLKGGIVCYDACIKEELLKVKPSLIKKYTPESMEVTKAIAEGLRKLIPADLHIGITGLTCPGGSETADKPVGTMFIYAAYDQGMLFSRQMHFTGEREDIVYSTVVKCAELLNQHLAHL